MTTPTPADRLALTICSASKGRKKPPCATSCGQCRRISQLYARELAAILRERHGHSETADWLNGIGEHPPTANSTMKRDPFLPPPAVVDWLLKQTWSSEIPEARVDYCGHVAHGMYKTTLFDHKLALAEIGADAGSRIFLCSYGLDILGKDSAARKAGAYDTSADGQPAQPEPVGPTSDELRTMAAEFAARTPEEFALAVLARWGRPAIEPVPVAERPWEREGWCDAQGTCWMWHPINFHYRLCSPDPSAHTHSLPHWVLPLPATTPTP
jgi:hypothetical protein